MGLSSVNFWVGSLVIVANRHPAGRKEIMMMANLTLCLADAANKFGTLSQAPMVHAQWVVPLLLLLLQ